MAINEGSYTADTCTLFNVAYDISVNKLETTDVQGDEAIAPTILNSHPNIASAAS